jgi:hypothetical protein
VKETFLAPLNGAAKGNRFKKQTRIDHTKPVKLVIQVTAVAEKQFRLLLKLGLSEGIFSYSKSQCGYNLKGNGMEIVGIFYGHLV